VWCGFGGITVIKNKETSCTLSCNYYCIIIHTQTSMTAKKDMKIRIVEKKKQSS
jgi:hypothetical protein